MGWIKLTTDLATKHGKVRKAGSIYEVTADHEKELLDAGFAVPHNQVPDVPLRIDPQVQRQMELAKRKQVEEQVSAQAREGKKETKVKTKE